MTRARLITNTAIALTAVLAFTMSAGSSAMAADDTSVISETAPTDAISPTPVCLGDSFTISGSDWTPGTYEVSITNADAVSLLPAGPAPQFVVVEDGTFTLDLTARADAPVGSYPDAKYGLVGEDAGGWFASPVTAADCTPTEMSASTPTIAGVLAVGAALTAEAGVWQDGANLSYQWFADGSPIASATTETLVLGSALVGKRISVTVTGQKDGFADTARQSVPTAKVILAGAPVISGSAVVGSTLAVAAGTWTPGTTYAFQWLADGEPIAGATASTFVVTAEQDGAAISAAVTGSKPDYATVEKASAASAFVMRAGAPTISGYAAYGSTLTAVAGTWSADASFAYQWYADGKAISGATKVSYKVASAQKAKKISVKVTGKKLAHTTVSKTSAATAKVATAGTPAVSGVAVYGSTLTAKPGTWTSGTSFSYQWYADGSVISGATKSTFKIGTAQKGSKITVKVTGKKSGYATVPKTSSATLKVATVATPTISGSTKVTHSLSAKPGAWTSGTTFSYQWYANGKAISGATKSTLKLGSSLNGKKITVKVTGKRSGYPTVSKTSKSTSAVSYPSRTSPSSEWNCPSWAPIKGNASSGIYHVPGGQYYSRTKPEECFRTESAARDAGYRKSKR